MGREHGQENLSTLLVKSLRQVSLSRRWDGRKRGQLLKGPSVYCLLLKTSLLGWKVGWADSITITHSFKLWPSESPWCREEYTL